MERIVTPWLVRRPNGRPEAKFDAVAAFKCASCGWASVGVVEGLNGVSTNSFDDPKLVVNWYPLKATGKPFPDVPEHIGGAAKEATECLSLGHFRAAVILARAVVEAVAKDQQITKGSIQQKIDSMQSSGLIRTHTQEAAHEIRYMANEMAHGDFTASVDPDEAEDVLNFMEALLEEVYQGPARVNRQKAARQKRTSQATQPPSTP
ncbi:DUF4145 domain-containing protein [Nocardia fluminea]|uniref:DUF4145 domain-containing protein n=1 Tax=Nocardia fluminea TaxID=134984 RepID=UPI0033EB4F4E